ncbi:MAG: hypothetical protein AAFZ02_12760, partial [Pseudomonadota bacterium]
MDFEALVNEYSGASDRPLEVFVRVAEQALQITQKAYYNDGLGDPAVDSLVDFLRRLAVQLNCTRPTIAHNRGDERLEDAASYVRRQK